MKSKSFPWINVGLVGVLISVVGAVGLSSFSVAQDFEHNVVRDPVGETAYYEVDTDRERTSPIVRGGEVTANVIRFVEDPEGGDGAYEVHLDYELRLLFGHRENGSESIEVPWAYFQPEFMENLRQEGHFEDERFKVEHLGTGDAETMDGEVYLDCDKIRIYDIDSSGDIENIEIHAFIAPDVPVLGAVKIDVTGRWQGQRLRLGGDYLAEMDDE